jgi:hypothetical protein
LLVNWEEEVKNFGKIMEEIFGKFNVKKLPLSAEFIVGW